METREQNGRMHALRSHLFVIGLAPALFLLAAACGSTPTRTVRVEDALLDPVASARTRAVAQVGRDGDVARVPDLIELLDDPDPAVRMAAGATLEDLTGHDTGYKPWAGVAEQRQHVRAWRAWWAGRGEGKR